MKGIYVIHLPEMDQNIYKIGCSGNITNRFHLFNSDTLRLYPIEEIYVKEFNDYKLAEKYIHTVLNEYRIKSNKEFFRGDIEYIINVINSVSDEQLSIFDNKLASQLLQKDSNTSICSALDKLTNSEKYSIIKMLDKSKLTNTELCYIKSYSKDQ